MSIFNSPPPPLTVESMKGFSLMFKFLYLGMLISQKLLEVMEINLSHGITVSLGLSLYPFIEIRNILFDLMCH